MMFLRKAALVAAPLVALSVGVDARLGLKGSDDDECDEDAPKPIEEVPVFEAWEECMPNWAPALTECQANRGQMS